MEKSKKYLSDIQLAIELIKKFTQELNTYDEYEKDLKTQSAVERQLSIVGEALNQLRKLEIPINHGDKIIGLRNRIIHAYDSIDSTIIWTIIKKHLDNLVIEVNDLMRKN